MSDTRPEFSFSVDVTALPQAGRRYEIRADETERTRIAARLGLVGVSALSATFDLTPRSGGLVHVAGVVHAAVTQSCVVSLVPVAATIEDSVDVRFVIAAPESAKKPRKDDGPDEPQDLVDLGEEEPTEPAAGGVVDLGELAVVHLALALDPYPRAAGAAFEAGAWGENDEKSVTDSPFAVLAKLKRSPPPKGG